MNTKDMTTTLNQLILEDISNIKTLQSPLLFGNQLVCYQKHCDTIIHSLLDIDNMKFLKFRDLLYDIFIYNLDITDCVWYILSYLVKDNKLTDQVIPEVLIKTYSFFQYYNNNYRPIYHLENYMFFLASHIHQFSTLQ